MLDGVGRSWGWLEDTLDRGHVADHGDEFFEHGSLGHRRTLYEEVVQVPLLLRHPSLLPAGVEVDGLVSLLDLPATILELVGLDQVPGTYGTSAVAMIRGQAEDRSVLFRVVQSHNTEMRAKGVGRVPGVQFFVTDTFRKGAIKITRMRTWSKPSDPDSGVPEATIEANIQAFRSREHLTWIDLEAHPAEEIEAHSTKFDDPARARRAARVPRRVRAARPAACSRRGLERAAALHRDAAGARLRGGRRAAHRRRREPPLRAPVARRARPGGAAVSPSTWARGAARLAVLLVVAGLAACSGGTSAPELNVLLISLDSTRRDLLSCYGRVPAHAPERSTSPNLDRLAAGGAVLEDAATTTSWTLPSHVSLLTGLSGVEHAVEESVHSYDGRQPTLAEILRERGYRTAGFYSGPFLAPEFGFARGFDRYVECYGDALARAARTAEARVKERDAAKARGDQRAFLELYKATEHAQKALQAASHRDVSSAAVTDAALAELDIAAAGDAPFFLFAHYFDPHYDYTPPPEHDVFDPDYDGRIDGVDFYDGPHVAGPARGPGPRERRISDRDLERVLALYEAELAWTDAQVGRLLDRLDELGVADRTLVIVTSDHGDEFFEHGAIGHRRTLYDEVLRVPLIVRLPGTIPAGTRARGLVSIQDVPATVLEALGLPASAAPSSRSFLALARGEDDGAGRTQLARLVMSFPRGYPAPPNAPVDSVPGRERHVVETWREGPIKITRRRSWAEPLMRTGTPLDAQWAEETRRRRSAEELTWIDVEAHPDERPEDASSDFGDPHARAALESFRDAYAGLVARRGDSAFVEQDEGLQSMLRGLGYTGGDDPGEDPTDALVLPLPGDAVLGR